MSDSELDPLLIQAQQGCHSAWQQLDDRFRSKLKRIVHFRLDPKLSCRIDASDVVQETLVEAFKSLDKYMADRKWSFFLWLRLLAANRLSRLHRFHLGSQKRSVEREFHLNQTVLHDASSVLIAEFFVADQTHPESRLKMADAVESVVRALESLSTLDREIIVLRHLEQLSNREVAEVLQITPGGASKRYFRALEHLRTVLDSSRAQESSVS